MEVAVGSLSNRKQFHTSREAMSLPFQKENRFKEYWRSMFLYKTDTPSEGDALFGNFYIESDEGDFATQRDMMLDVVESLVEKGVPRHVIEFFVTNRSIWLSVPAKVFGSFGSPMLHEIYRSMATEIQTELNGKGYIKGIDLSIYRWNGLIHSLGSHLPKTRSWVSKFEFGDLEMALTIQDLRNAPYDNGSSFRNIQISTKAKAWYDKNKCSIHSPSAPSEKRMPIHFESMKRLEDRGTLDTDRNLHIYTYSLYLKQCGLSVEEAVLKVQSVFDDPYVQTRECLRTIRSAIEGKKHFNPGVAATLLDADLFEGLDETNGVEKDTFIVPRLFIDRLQEMRANHHLYRLMLQVLYAYQIDRKPFMLDMKGEKYKQDILSRFEKLAGAGIVSYVENQGVVTAKVVHHAREVYQSHIVVSRRFVENDLAEIGKELPLLMEVWRGGYKVSEQVWYVATKMKTMVKRLRSKTSTVRRLFAMLQKSRLVFGKFAFMETRTVSYKQKVQEWVSSLRGKGDQMRHFVSSEGVVANPEGASIETPSQTEEKSTMKCNYSLYPKSRPESPDINGFGASPRLPVAEVVIS